MRLLLIIHHNAEELFGFCVAFMLGKNYLMMHAPIDWIARAENLAFALFTAFIVALLKYLFPNGVARFIGWFKIIKHNIWLKFRKNN